MIKYVGRAKALRNELATATVVVNEHYLSHNILLELPSGYAMINTVLKSKMRELRIAVVTSHVLASEKGLESADDADIPPTVLAYISRMDIKKREQKEADQRKLVCSYCKRPLHKIADCLKRKDHDGKKTGGG